MQPHPRMQRGTTPKRSAYSALIALALVAACSLTTQSGARATGRADANRTLWAFQPLRTPDVPAIDDDGWSANPIDRFILRKLREHDLQPAPKADRRTLIRRAYFDLIGLPPTPEEVDAFVADDSPTAYEDLIERLLASPHYGERWGRHWLDLVRYAESDGHGNDRYRPEAWRYRDYVISAFNDDKPYDRFILEQLAGDELAPDDPAALTATGFLRHWVYESNQRKVREVRRIILDDVTDVTADVFLALSFGCARCHDHKFDPISQKDYYGLQAFFAPMLPRDDIAAATPQQAADFEAKRSLWEQETETIRRKIAELEAPARQAAIDKGFKMFPQDIKDIYRSPRDRQNPLERQLVALVDRVLDGAQSKIAEKLDDDAKAQWQKLQRQLAEFDRVKPEPLPFPMLVTDVGPSAPPTMLPGKGEPLDPAFPAALTSCVPDIEPPLRAPDSTGRRTALARWIASPENPLTARVIVNRIWQYHFGTGLVSTSSDFGTLGDAPSHPELLDWLAARFIDNGWSFKEMHRLIMTSATYRQSIHSRSELATRIDPQNRWLARSSIRRFDAEQLRDGMLAVSGELDTTRGGPSVDADVPRRTVYAKVIRNTPDPLLRAMDAPDGFISTPCREVTTTPTQALMLLNGDWTLARAETMARRLLIRNTSGDAKQLVRDAYRLALGREPDPFEAETSNRFLLREYSDSETAGALNNGDIATDTLTDFCHVLLNSNEFIYVD